MRTDFTNLGTTELEHSIGPEVIGPTDPLLFFLPPTLASS